MEEMDNTCVCKYTGYKPNEIGLSLERVDVDKVSSEDFFRLFIRPRKPAILTRLQKPMSALQTLWTDEYLIQTAGKAQVAVEKRADYTDASFGVVAPKVSMQYGDFISECKAGNDRLYMTTQDPDYNEEEDIAAGPKLLSEPLLSLRKDFSLQPELLGHLVPYQVSLWQGFARDGASSGLHHDFHDNLYLLLRGKKRFRLFPPSAAPSMSTHGKIEIVYPNGLIVYRRSTKNGNKSSKIYVREDGARKKDVAQAKQERAESEMQAAEEELSKLEETGGMEMAKEALLAKIAKCESDIEASLDELLEYNSDNEEEEEEDGSCSEAFSDEASGSENGVEDDEPQRKKHRTEEVISNSDVQSNGNKSWENHADGNSTDVPDHFSKLTLPGDDEKFKNYMNADTTLKNVSYIVCHLHAGEMLYLPASWLHEVTSYSDADDQGGQAGHLALNYWVYPPDSDQFERPYRDSYWHDHWNSVKDHFNANDTYSN